MSQDPEKRGRILLLLNAVLALLASGACLAVAAWLVLRVPAQAESFRTAEIALPALTVAVIQRHPVLAAGLALAALLAAASTIVRGRRGWVVGLNLFILALALASLSVCTLALALPLQAKPILPLP